jgi:hypothetical protein
MSDRKSVGVFWYKDGTDREGNPVRFLSGKLDIGVGRVNIVANKYKKEGETKPDFYAYPIDGVPKKEDEEVPI